MSRSCCSALALCKPPMARLPPSRSLMLEGCALGPAEPASVSMFAAKLWLASWACAAEAIAASAIPAAGGAAAPDLAAWPLPAWTGAWSASGGDARLVDGRCSEACA